MQLITQSHTQIHRLMFLPSLLALLQRKNQRMRSWSLPLPSALQGPCPLRSLSLLCHLSPL